LKELEESVIGSPSGRICSTGAAAATAESASKSASSLLRAPVYEEVRVILRAHWMLLEREANERCGIASFSSQPLCFYIYLFCLLTDYNNLLRKKNYVKDGSYALGTRTK
jgi:hypothetical protein